MRKINNSAIMTLNPQQYTKFFKITFYPYLLSGFQSKKRKKHFFCVLIDDKKNFCTLRQLKQFVYNKKT